MRRSHKSPFKVLITNIPETATKKSLEKLFSPYGPLVFVEIQYSQKGSPPKALISLSSKEKMEMAISALDSSDYAGNKISVSEYIQPSSQLSRHSQKKSFFDDCNDNYDDEFTQPNYKAAQKTESRKGQNFSKSTFRGTKKEENKQEEIKSEKKNRKKMKVIREPKDQRSWAERFLTRNHNYLKVLVLFFILWKIFIHPQLISIFVVNHEHDLKNSYSYGELIDVFLYYSNNPSNRKSYRELASSQRTNYSAGFVGHQIIDYNLTLNLTTNIRKNKTKPFLIVEAIPVACHGKEFVVNNRPCFRIQAQQPIIRWTQNKPTIKYNLIKGKKPTKIVDSNKSLPWIPSLFTNMSFDIVAQKGVLNPEEQSMFSLSKYRYSEEFKVYLPAIAYDDTWDLSDRRKFLNFNEDPKHSETKKPNIERIPIRVMVYMRSFWLWKQKVEFEAIYSQEGNYIKKSWEDIKRALLEKPILLYCTLIVTVLRSIFSFMAFHAEVTWWSEKSEFSGVSVRSQYLDLLMNIISMLYICDEDTSMIVRILHGIQLVIQLWKIWKLYEPIMDFPYFKVKVGYRQKETDEADSIGFKHLGWIVIPAIIVFSIYHLWVGEYKSIYSYIIKVAAGSAYAFGFLAMLPQLYINYKLKSVAGMSGNTLIYKTINTFIDDMFAFTMKMPLLYRIACFRDDIVFFIWLYQRHVYPTDSKRMNEFGEILEHDDESEEENEGNDEESENEGNDEENNEENEGNDEENNEENEGNDEESENEGNNEEDNEN